MSKSLPGFLVIFAFLVIVAATAVSPDSLALANNSQQVGSDGIIAFTSILDGDNEIFFIYPDGSGLRQLTHNDANDGFPEISPDGAQVAFESYRGENWDIYIVNMDGTDLRRFTDNPEGDYDATWSPDGEYIAYSSIRDDNMDVYVARVDGSEDRRLTTHPERDGWAAWSPDGTQIVFASGREGDYQIYVMDADGSNQRQLTHHDGGNYSPVWFPDGALIAFESDREGPWGIYVMDPDGSNVLRLTSDQIYASWPAWSLDGTRIVFSAGLGSESQLNTMDRDGGDARSLLITGVQDDFADWGVDSGLADQLPLSSCYASRGIGSRPNIRTGPGLNYPAFTTLRAGRSMAVIGFSGNWVAITTYQDRSGWMAGWVINLVGDCRHLPQFEAPPTPPVSMPQFVAGQCMITYIGNAVSGINIRSGPGLDYSVIAQLQPGDSVDVGGFNGEWFAVDYQGQVGWIADLVSQPRGHCGTLPYIEVLATPNTPDE